ncbi:hypothetical protein [Pseudonocardia oroxyli]|uniref:Uncharacterized protein n=1 Tax=Pseudonocardia oroxyli TaxID=366584 RepID=A0A1G7QQJ5_PSEOR|nr:hypothetical protein [Pseudonocardia oroxyli]SDG00149.1 hypothetical protein SAMN05216377_108137 [Pseudonocardia oroxyli]
MTERLPGRLLRGFSGVLCAGLVALFAVLVGGWVFTTRTGAPGPGPGMLLGHGLAAAAAVAAQLVADRRAGRVGALAAWVVVALAALVLGGYWLF